MLCHGQWSQELIQGVGEFFKLDRSSSGRIHVASVARVPRAKRHIVWNDHFGIYIKAGSFRQVAVLFEGLKEMDIRKSI